MPDIVALGCGLVGNFVVTKLAQRGYSVHVIDLTIPDSIKDNQLISYQEGDVFEILKYPPEAKVIVNLLPGNIGEQVRSTLILNYRSIIDLAFTEIEPSIHNKLAIENDSTLIWDVGIAPGLSNMLIRLESELDENIKDVSIKVGGNPAIPDQDWSYMAPFSPADVIEEYTRPARIIVNGTTTTVSAISDLHSIEVEGYGTMEAFLTDGLRSLINSKMSPNMREYTVRWPGHIQKWIAERGKLTDIELIDAWKFDEERPEFTWMEVTIEYAEHKIIWEIVDNGLNGFSSMARTTGLVTIACVETLLAKTDTDGETIKFGVLAPEDLPLDSIEQVIQYVKSENVTIIRKLIE